LDIGYITNGITQDGFGSRMSRAIEAMAFTFYLQDKFDVNIEYIHTPFSFEGFDKDFTMGESVRTIYGPHNQPNLFSYNMTSRNGYLKRALLWDKYMCYSGITINDIELCNITNIFDAGLNKFKLFDDISKHEYNNKLYFIEYLHMEFRNRYIDYNIVSEYYNQIKNRFNLIISDMSNDIILQIRRNDVSIGAKYYDSSRYLEDEYYLNILQYIAISYTI
jgi:hypothetical protein